LAVTVTRSIDLRLLPSGIGTLQTTPPNQWGGIMADAAMMTSPLRVMFLTFPAVRRPDVKG
jgi:hypothetical protein